MAKQKRETAEREKPDLNTTLEALRAGEEGKLSATIFYGLSGLSSAELQTFLPVWEALSAGYRRKVMRRMVEIAEANFELDYRALGTLMLNDPDPGVREAAIELLWEDQSLGLMNRLIELAQWDEVRQVRAAALSALGRFILAGELGELPEAQVARAQEVAVTLLTEEEDVDVRRRALEAISNSSHEIVEEAIREAYNSHEHRMRVSALFAMGRSCDEQWDSIVLRELDSDDPEMRYEAARAAGELEIVAAVPRLVSLASGSDREIKETAIWSLGEIGGSDAVRALSLLARKAEESGDDDLMEAIEDAVASASLVDDEFLDLRSRLDD
jgi:HEAT repeat protein